MERNINKLWEAPKEVTCTADLIKGLSEYFGTQWYIPPQIVLVFV